MFLDIFIIGILIGFLVLFLNYIIGKPGSDKFSPYEIFSSYTVWLSKRRLKKVGLLWDYNHQYKENEERVQSKSQLITLRNDYKIIYYEAAEPFFTWERAVGMCPVCFGVWVAIISWNLYLVAFNYHGFGLFLNLIFLLSVIVISHITIRILSKII